jgi:hypothetical protein
MAAELVNTSETARDRKAVAVVLVALLSAVREGERAV